MDLKKLKIKVETEPGTFPEDADTNVEVQFNPEEIEIERSVTWARNAVPESDTPELQFIQGRGSTFNIDLHFDTFLEAEDVTDTTQEVVDLSEVRGSLHRPPICKLSYGRFVDFFEGVLTKVHQKLTLFLSDGTPVRATLACCFTEWKSIEKQIKEQKPQSTNVAKTYVVKQGDSLSAIAAHTLHSPLLWRPIADANGIENPRKLTPGQRLIIPVVEAGGR